MLKKFAALIFSALFVLSVQAQNSTASLTVNSAPDVIVRTVMEEVLNDIRNDKEIKDGNVAKVVVLVETKILPHVNFRRMTALAIGKDWRKVDEAQKQRLTEAFKNLLIRTYANALVGYGEEKLVFKPLKMKDGADEVTVRVEVHQPGAKPIDFDTRMEKSDKGWKVFDVSLAGISLVTNYREQFAQEIRQNGIPGLIDLLENKSQGLVEAAQKATADATDKKAKEQK